MKSIPDCVWRYWGIIELMESNPALYTMDDMRTEAHDEVCKYYKITREQALPITNNLDKYGMPYKDPSMFVMALEALATTGEIITFPENPVTYIEDM